MCLLQNYPASAPRVTVVPSANMSIAPKHPHVGEDGVVDMPMLRTWNQQASLMALVRALSAIFQEKMPVFDRRRQVRPASSGRVEGVFAGNRATEREKARKNVSPVRRNSEEGEPLQRQIAELETRQSELMRVSSRLEVSKTELRSKAVSPNVGETTDQFGLTSPFPHFQPACCPVLRFESTWLFRALAG